MSTKIISKHARAAKEIRKELKNAFPGTLFKVKSRSYLMGNNVDIYWKDGPARKTVDRMTKKYQMGYLDAMPDSYEHSNVNNNIPQVKFVFLRRIP